MKKITRLFSTLMFSLFALCLVACGGPNVADEALKLLIVDPVGYVETDFQLPGTIMYNGVEYDLTWTSNNEHIVISDVVEVDDVKYYVAQVVRPTNDEGAEIIVTAHLNIDGKKATKDFEYTLYPIDVFEVADAYKFSKANKALTEELELETSTEYCGLTATIEWSVPENYTKYYTIENNIVKFNVQKDVEVKIDATFTYNETKTKITYNMTLKSTVVPPTTIDPIDGQELLFGLYQESSGTYLYFAGKTTDKDYYMATTDKAEEATKVTATAVEGGYTLSFVNAAGATKYLDVVLKGTYVNLNIVDKPSSPFQYNTDHQTFTKDVDGTLYYIGTYSTYTTFSACKFSKIAESYPTHFYQLPEALSVVDQPVAGKSYVFGMVQGSDGTTYYFAGKEANFPYYMSTVKEANKSTKVTVEEAEDGFYLSFIDAEGNKKYLDTVLSGKYINVLIKDKPTSVYTWDAEYKTFVTEVSGEKAFLGTYKTYTTISANKYADIAEKYPCHLYE